MTHVIICGYSEMISGGRSQVTSCLIGPHRSRHGRSRHKAGQLDQLGMGRQWNAWDVYNIIII